LLQIGSLPFVFKLSQLCYRVTKLAYTDEKLTFLKGVWHL